MLRKLVAAVAITSGLASAAPFTAQGCLNGICPSAPVFKRSTCNADNLLRRLESPEYRGSASAFCSTYIQPSITTATATYTQTPSPVIVVETDITVLSTTVTTTSTDYPTAINTFKKRDGPYPTFISATYPASRVSSACSCLVTLSSPPTPSTTVTTTLPPSSVLTTITTTSLTGPTETATAPGPYIYCDVPGCSSADQLLASNIGTVNSTQSCSTECVATSNCHTYQFGTNPDSSTVCNLFSGAVWDVFLNGSTTSPYCRNFALYNVLCTFPETAAVA
ncbi:MAG: hypothetical protein M1824_001738 [Vezdaea acicularis]|nr:MAG: hypothetical protein M1824_001738 [Vezdaea acicularis]